MAIRAFLPLLVLAAALPSAVAADPIAPRARLSDGADGTRLVVSGHRADAAAPVLLMGHEVEVTGGRRWRAALPLATVRAWASPFARSIAVEVAGPAGGRADARLPTGLLGHRAELAFLDVGGHR